MTRKEVSKLFELFGALRNEKITPKDNQILAWTLALEPFKYDTIKAAALSHFRKHNYIPSPAEIIAEIPQDIADAAIKPAQDDDPQTPQEAEALKMYRILTATRKAKGLPEHLSEAHAHGMTANELADKYEEANVSFAPVARVFFGT
jgi:hypothetical protein